MNPPYSLSWSGKPDYRCAKHGTPPKSKADYLFVLHGLSIMKPAGKLLAVLPHGVLFRGAAEGGIRESLIQSGLIRTVVGLPDKLFEITQIPVCILELQPGSKDCFFIDASRQFCKDGKMNILKEAHLATIENALALRRDVDKLAHLATISEIESNGYNLNIPRYVDISEPPAPIDVAKVVADLAWCDNEIARIERELAGQILSLVSTTGQNADLEKIQDHYRRISECELSKDQHLSCLTSNEQRPAKSIQPALF